MFRVMQLHNVGRDVRLELMVLVRQLGQDSRVADGVDADAADGDRQHYSEEQTSVMAIFI